MILSGTPQTGNSAEWEFAHTVNLTDIHKGWTESRSLSKNEVAMQEARKRWDEIQAELPFRLLGAYSGNGSEFTNWHIKRWRH